MIFNISIPIRFIVKQQFYTFFFPLLLFFHPLPNPTSPSPPNLSLAMTLRHAIGEILLSVVSDTRPLFRLLQLLPLALLLLLEVVRRTLVV